MDRVVLTVYSYSVLAVNGEYPMANFDTLQEYVMHVSGFVFEEYSAGVLIALDT
jgi:hypothetical protein